MSQIDRRGVLTAGIALGAGLLPACGSASASAGRPPGSIPSDMQRKTSGFVRREGQRLLLDGKPYRFVGANLWYGAYLGADAAYGDRARLGRELDRLQALGVSNVRILASAEEGPLQHSIKPGFRSQHDWNEPLLQGLDYCLAELAKRDLKAVLYLTNFWEWSGGMGSYLWYASGNYLDNGDPAHPWPAFPDHNAEFYATPSAVEMFHDHVRRVVSRKNSLTGVPYKDDPTLMAWQLCNEPRPGASEETIARVLPAYYAWIDGSAQLIRALDSEHLVSLGLEGTIVAEGREDIVLRAHAAVDYVTAHVWPLNWGWVSGKDLPGTWEAGAKRAAEYVQLQERLAASLDKPLVIEEFGFPRDGEKYDPSSQTSFRQRYYALIYGAVEASVAAGGPICGSNFWAWNGEARAEHADYRFQAGDRRYMGDPPHEPQGWYGNFDSDQPMLELIRAHAARLHGSA
jgi:mannan endo-1,4-beta-mannosidase